MLSLQTKRYSGANTAQSV